MAHVVPSINLPAFRYVLYDHTPVSIIQYSRATCKTTDSVFIVLSFRSPFLQFRFPGTLAVGPLGPFQRRPPNEFQNN